MRLAIVVGLISHFAITVWSLRDAGFFAPFPPFAEDYVYQIFSDLGAALLISVVLIYAQVERLRMPRRGFIVMAMLIPIVGSFSPLAYLALNPELLSGTKSKE